MVKQQGVFKDFSEWWYYARTLTEHQRSMIFDNLSKEQKVALENSYTKEGWEDVFCRNEIDALLDTLREKYKYDILDIRNKVLKGKSVYLPLKFWNILQEHLDQYKPESIKYIVAGMRAIPCKANHEVVLLVSAASNTTDISD